MKTTVFNIPSAEKIFDTIRQMILKNPKVNISYDFASNPKTKKQIGFFFGALCFQTSEYLIECGYNCDIEDTKSLMYKKCSEICPELIRETPLGNKRIIRLSEKKMTKPLMSKFIESVFYVIDNNPMFKELRLTPDIRYNWINHLDKQEIINAQKAELPERDKDYLRYIRQQPCIVCGNRHPCEAHHWKQNIITGISEKSPDWMAMPLCVKCHQGLAHNYIDQFKKSLSWISIDMIDFLRLCYRRAKRHL